MVRVLLDSFESADARATDGLLPAEEVEGGGRGIVTETVTTEPSASVLVMVLANGVSDTSGEDTADAEMKPNPVAEVEENGLMDCVAICPCG